MSKDGRSGLRACCVALGAAAVIAASAHAVRADDVEPRDGGERALLSALLRSALGPGIDGARSYRTLSASAASACIARRRRPVQIRSAPLRAPLVTYGGVSIPGGPAAATRFETTELPWTYAYGAIVTCERPDQPPLYLTFVRGRGAEWRIAGERARYEAAAKIARAREPHALSSIEADVPPRAATPPPPR